MHGLQNALPLVSARFKNLLQHDLKSPVRSARFKISSHVLINEGKRNQFRTRFVGVHNTRGVVGTPSRPLDHNCQHGSTILQV